MSAPIQAFDDVAAVSFLSETDVLEFSLRDGELRLDLFFFCLGEIWRMVCRHRR
jgi:hypothetical protein